MRNVTNDPLFLKSIKEFVFDQIKLDTINEKKQIDSKIKRKSNRKKTSNKPKSERIICDQEPRVTRSKSLALKSKN